MNVFSSLLLLRKASKLACCQESWVLRLISRGSCAREEHQLIQGDGLVVALHGWKGSVVQCLLVCRP